MILLNKSAYDYLKASWEWFVIWDEFKFFFHNATLLLW